MAHKLYTYTQHTTHVRARTSHAWTEIRTEIERGRGTIPAMATKLGKYTWYTVAPDGLTLELWHTQRRPY